MPPARVELFIFGIDRVMDRLGIERGVDVAQKRHDVRIGIADAEHFEIILVHVDDVELIFPDADFAQGAQFIARALEKGEGLLEFAGDMRVRGSGSTHGKTGSPLAAVGRTARSRAPRPNRAISAGPPALAKGASFQAAPRWPTSRFPTRCRPCRSAWRNGLRCGRSR